MTPLLIERSEDILHTIVFAKARRNRLFMLWLHVGLARDESVCHGLARFADQWARDQWAGAAAEG